MSYLVIIVLTRRPEALPARSRDLSSDHASETVAYRRKSFVVPSTGSYESLSSSFILRHNSLKTPLDWLNTFACAGSHSKPFLIG